MQTNESYFGVILRYLVVLYACPALIITGGLCSTNDAEQARFPRLLVKAAEAFHLASETNRYAEALELSKQLPTCPVTFEKDIGTGVIRRYDFSKPSYILPSKDVLALIGEPFLIKTNADGLVYSYLINGKSPEASWSLAIEFRNDCVVLSNVRGPVSPKK